MRDLPLLPTMGVGSYATPGWMHLFRDAMRDGRPGPADVEEAFRDATRIAIDDQLDAGIDMITDGELTRMRFVYEMYDRIGGLTRIPPTRRLGVPGYDRAPKFVANEPIRAPDGLGLVEEWRAFSALCPDRPRKIAFPGPLTFARNISPGRHYADAPDPERAVLIDVTALIAAEVAALIAAGATLVQLDEPGFANPPTYLSIEEGAEFVNVALGGHRDATAVHVCFGNNASRPYVRRDMGRLFPAIGSLDCSMLMLEFANREMADLELIGPLAARFDIAAGVIDVKSFHEETGDEVAARLRRVLEHVPAERLVVTADCGFSALPRWLARHKLHAMVEGARIVRNELGAT